MSIICVNPECFQGDPGNPPEYESDNSKPCVRCGQDIDLDDDEYTEEDDGYLCDDCNAVTEKDDEEAE